MPINNLTKKYDPDELVLTKQDILQTLYSIRAIWIKRGRIKNAKFIIAIEMFINGLKLVGDNEVSAIFRWTLKFIDQLRYENFMAKDESSAKVLSKVRTSWLDNADNLAKEIFS